MKLEGGGLEFHSSMKCVTLPSALSLMTTVDCPGE